MGLPFDVIERCQKSSSLSEELQYQSKITKLVHATETY